MNYFAHAGEAHEAAERLAVSDIVTIGVVIAVIAIIIVMRFIRPNN